MIKQDELKEALIRSGYLLESRLAKVLNEYGYFVESNPIFEDPLSGKSREIDILTRRGPQNENFKYISSKVSIENILVIEAKNSPVPVCFFEKSWISDGDTFFYDTFLIETNYQANNKLFLDEYSKIQERYLKLPYCSQYCSFTQKKGKKKEWMAYHPDNLYSSISSMLNFSQKTYESWKNHFSKETYNFQRFWMIRPVLVINGDILIVNEDGNNIILKEVNHLVLLASTISAGQNISSSIDVMTEKYFSTFIQNVMKDEEKMYKAYLKKSD